MSPCYGCEEIGDWQPGLGHRTAEVSPDGRGVVFTSNRSLPVSPGGVRYPNSGLDEIYTYDAVTDRLYCVSCSRNGEAPLTNISGAAAYLPVSFWGTNMPQWISEDGARVFFDSAEPLVPQDTNGVQDVYEWERDGSGSCGEAAGCVYLLSGGASRQWSWLVGGSASGNDVFMVTKAQLVPQDGNENDDLYDARVDGVNRYRRRPARAQVVREYRRHRRRPYPLFIPQAGAPPAPIYLTGPYRGAPFGLSIVVPLIAGPFNLGTEVVRARIEVDRHTSQITVVTDPLPTIVKGIPADLRSINAVIDRPEFMFNPTDCNPMSFSGTATSTEGVVAPLSSHFQMGSCQALKFAPNFKVSTSGKTSRASGASLTAKIVYPTGNLGFNQASSQSNIASVKVDLPKQLPSRLTTLQKACPAKTFEVNPALCPSDSIVGHARALTPVLPVPIEGPAYFVSHAGEEFPNLIIVFQGDNVTIDLVGSTFISKAGITSSTFKQVPDVPIGLFELTLPQGKYSALAANANLCKSALKMPTAFTAQNGAVMHQTTSVSVTGCAKHKTVKAKQKSKSGKRKKR